MRSAACAAFGQGGAFFLEVSGQGELWFTSYGGIEVVDVNGPFMVDNGHLVGSRASSIQHPLGGGGMLGFVLQAKA